MPQNNRLKIIIVAALVLVGAIVWYLLQPSPDACDYSLRVKVADRFSLTSNETSVKSYPNWYKCHKPEIGDAVYYSFGNDMSYLRYVVAKEGDEIEIAVDLQKRGWNLIVNGKLLMAGDSPYYFGLADRLPTLAIYMSNYKRTLAGDDLILMATAPPGFNDSGLFGLFSTRSITTKLDLPSDEKKKVDDYFANAYSDEKVEETLAAFAELRKKGEPQIKTEPPTAKPVPKQPAVRQPVKSPVKKAQPQKVQKAPAKKRNQ